VAENINISANGERVLFTRDVANVIMDLNDVDSIDFTARGGADNIVINDLSGTDVTEINLDLGATPDGAGDGQADTVTINATNGDDVILVFGDNGGVSVLGLSAQVNIVGFDATIDRMMPVGCGTVSAWLPEAGWIADGTLVDPQPLSAAEVAQIEREIEAAEIRGDAHVVIRGVPIPIDAAPRVLAEEKERTEAFATSNPPKAEAGAGGDGGTSTDRLVLLITKTNFDGIDYDDKRGEYLPAALNFLEDFLEISLRHAQ
jgi:hypothetical protein